VTIAHLTPQHIIHGDWLTAADLTEIFMDTIDPQLESNKESQWLTEVVTDCCIIATTTEDNKRIKRILKDRRAELIRSGTIKKWRTTNQVLKKLIKSNNVSATLRDGFDYLDPLDTTP